MLPIRVESRAEAAVAAGFGLSCEPGVGRVLAVLAAAVPADGAILELGTGAGVGLAWIVEGLGGRTDVGVTSVELDPGAAAVAAAADWPASVELVEGDALAVLDGGRRWDLVFADAQGGKWEGLDLTISALAAGGLLVVDDMTPPAFVDDEHRTKTEEVRRRLLGDERLVSVEIGWSGGLIVCARRADGEAGD